MLELRKGGLAPGRGPRERNIVEEKEGAGGLREGRGWVGREV